MGGLLGGGAGHTGLSVVLALAIINLLHLVVAEQAPTYFGIERTKLAARYGSPILYAWTAVLGPIIRLGDWLAKAILSLFGVEITRSWAEEEQPASRGELRSQMGELLSRDGLPDEREQEVINALEIGEMTVEETMVEREGIIALSTRDSVDANIELMRKRQHTRFPLVTDTMDEFIGIVYTPVVLSNVDTLRNDDLDMEAIATRPMTVPANLSVSELIDRFQAENQELALVTENENGTSVIGLVTSTDAFEAIAGSLEYPFD